MILHKVIEIVKYRVLFAGLFFLGFIRIYKTQAITTNAVIRYNRGLR